MSAEPTTTPATQADKDAEAAFDRHIVETIGWTKFASMQTASSGAEYGRAFKAGYRAALTPSALSGDAGEVSVPRRPTQAMYEAAFESSPWDGSGPIRRVVDEVWAAMLDAAPSHQGAGE